MNRSHKMLNGATKFVEVQFRCQSCSHLFIDEEREFCEAPPVGQKLALQRVKAIHEARQSGEVLTLREEKLAKAIETLATKIERTPEEEAEFDRKVRFQLRVAYADVLLAFKQGKTTEHPGDVEQWIDVRFDEAKKQLSGGVSNVES